MLGTHLNSQPTTEIEIQRDRVRNRRMIAAVAYGALLFASEAAAISLGDVVASAYLNNPQLNAQRSFVRSTDEKVPQALSGYRPRINVTASAGYQYQEQTTTFGFDGSRVTGGTTPYTVGATASQTLFNGFQTANRVRASEAEVASAQAALRVLEQAIILASVAIYMDCLRDNAIATIQQSNLRTLETFLSQTIERFELGEVTRTDVAQARTQLAAARTQLALAEANLITTIANFIRITGLKPTKLAPASTIDQLHAPSLNSALLEASMENPRIAAARHGIDVAFLQVKINEGALFPTVGVVVSAQQQYNSSLTSQSQFVAAASGQISVPVYQGGAEFSLIRQSKESLSQQRQVLEQVRTEVRAEVVHQWALANATRIQLKSASMQVAAAELALDGVREEARLGQRTTLDVLNALQAIVVARLASINAQHDRVVSSYAVVAASGRLSPKLLKLRVPNYEPAVHYYQIRDSWAGVRAPGGQ